MLCCYLWVISNIIKFMQKSKLINQSFLNSNDKFIDQYLARLDESEDKTTYDNSISNFDQQLYHYYAAQNYLANPVSKQLYQMPNKNAVKLDIPKNNSLTDSMLRTTLGCEEKLAQSYLQIIDQTQKIEQQSKQKRIEQAKKKFASSNCHRDIFANSKAFTTNNAYYVERPVVDNEHDTFLKTQLTFLQPNATSKGPKEYIDKYTGNISKKIYQIGGIQDTIEPMEHSLSINQLSNLKNKQILSKSKQRKSSKSPMKTSTSGFFKTKEQNSWLTKSKQLRSHLTSSVFR